MIKPFLIIAFVVAVFASCSSSKSLYNWTGYDDAVYSYTKSSDENSMNNLIGIYEKLINFPDGVRQVPPPGVCADYGYILIKKGEVEKGKELLKKETILYPESKPFIDRILIRFDR